MATIKPYKTRQGELILKALENSPEQHATAEDLLAYLKTQGETIGFATVYRNLDKFVNEGAVLKYSLPDGTSACYQLLQNCSDDHHHFHVICTGCGKVSHLECNEVDALVAHLSQHHHIAINTQKTVFYGLCENCSRK